jgi:hypothetical protein
VGFDAELGWRAAPAGRRAGAVRGNQYNFAQPFKLAAIKTVRSPQNKSGVSP